MQPEVLTALPPFLQYGALGLCALTLGAFVWCVARFVRVMDRALEVIPPLTTAVHDLQTKVDDAGLTATKIHERLLQWDCPFRRTAPAES